MLDIKQSLIEAFAHHQAGAVDRAEKMYRAVLDDQPAEPNALHLLGIITRDRGDLSGAITLMERAVQSQPMFPEALTSLAGTHMMAGNPGAAAEPLIAAIRLDDGNGEAWLLLARQRLACGDLADAEEALKAATELAIDPDRTKVVQALAQRAGGDYGGAVETLEDLAGRHPDDVEILSALGVNYYDLRQFHRAEDFLRRAAELQPDYAEVHATLGNCRIEQGDIVGAMDAFRRSHEVSPFNSSVSSSLLFYMAFEPKVTAAKLFKEVKAWGDHISASVAPMTHTRPRARPGRLRIGYLSHEFGTHVTSYFFEPVIQRHDAERFETICFAANENADATTARLRDLAGSWCDVSTMADQEVAQQIRAERIDILVLVSSYRARHRVALAYKPAPIQVCYHNLVSSTGLGAVDYMITEELTDPSPRTDKYYTEKLVRLTNRNCYLPPSGSSDISAPPSDRNGFITFGSFNNVAKITPKIADLWVEILNRLPDARLRLKNINASRDFRDHQFLFRQFEQRGLSLDRIDILPTIAARTDHLAAYGDIDIALDTFPCNGGTTSCDAIWMGVPVVTRTGETFMGRQGLNYLTKLGLEDLIAAADHAYVEAAVTLANDPERLRSLRSSLRQTMKETMLDYDQHVAELEAAYDIMWARLVTGTTASGFSVAEQDT